MINETDVNHLDRCIELATIALEDGDEPCGSVLVDSEGAVRAEDRNRIATGDSTQHPEIALARWAVANMTPDERAAATVYTSDEHCPMCAATHGWVGLGRIVYASSAQQLMDWLEELGVPTPPVMPLAINEVVPGIPVEGPMPALAEAVRLLYWRSHGAT